MRKADVFFHGVRAGLLEETEPRKRYRFSYDASYSGPPISLTMPVAEAVFDFDRFPAFFDGLLPEGNQLEGLLRIGKIDRDDFFSQLVAVGAELVGAATVRERP